MGDGAVVLHGARLDLAAGPHTMSLQGTGCAVRRFYDPRARALVENPRLVPYLIPPELEFPVPQAL